MIAGKDIWTAEPFHTTLQQMNIRYESFTGMAEAAERTKKHMFQLLILDMQLPDGSGAALCRLIRQNEQNPNASSPILLITDRVDDRLLRMAQEAGANELLARSCEPQHLLAMLQKYLADDDRETGLTDRDDADKKYFSFDPRLDVDYLHRLYAYHTAHAAELFHLFLQNNGREMKGIHEALAMQDWGKLQHLVHKAKPNFSMVGLTRIAQMLQDIFDKLQQDDHATATSMLTTVDEEVEKYLPVIKSECQRMEESSK